VDSGGPKEAQVPAYSPGGLSVRPIVKLGLSSVVYTYHRIPGTTVSVRRLTARCRHRAPSASIIRQF